MAGFWRDFRNGLRLMMREPFYACFALAVLALGIGATTAIFSLVNGILLQPLPYRQPQQLYLIREIVPRMGQMEGSWPANLRNFDEWRKHSLAFSEMAVAEPMSADFSGAAEAKEIYGARVSANLLQLLGVSVRLGRKFLRQEDEPGRDNVVIVTNSFWRDELRSDPAIIGKAITLDGVPNEVIGVLPASFRFFKNDQLGARVQFGSQTEFFKPLGVDLSTVFPLGNFRSVGRLIVRDGMKPILLGMLVGIAASFVVGKAINSLFFGVRMGNPFRLALSAAIVLAVGLLACYVPVIATSRISPMQVLRSD